MTAIASNGVGQLLHALGAPLRWLRRRSRRAHALDVLYRAKEAYGSKAHVTVWDPRLRGGAGVISVERGSVQIHVDDDGYWVQWFGRDQHPVTHDEMRTAGDAALEAMVKKWTSRWFIQERRPTASAKHFEF